MSRTISALAVCIIALPGALNATLAAAEEIVRLPNLAVNEPAVHGDRPSTLTLAPGTTSAEAFSDLAKETVGFAVNDAGARGFGQTTTLRGLGNTPFFSDASAPVYLDDIPLASAFTFPSELYDFGQVAIYRGPQAAARFGRTGDAGVVQFTSASPGQNNRGNFSLSAGNYRQLSINASAQTAHREDADLSVNVGTNQRDGYIYNNTLKQTVDDRKAVFGRVRLLYRPAKDLEISLHLLGERSRDGAQALVPLGGPYFEVSRGKEGESDIDFGAVALGLTKHLTDGTITSTTSLSKWEMSPYSNRLVVFGGFDFDSVVTQSQRSFNEELRYVSEQVTGGAFYSHSRTLGGASRTFSGYTIEDSNFRQDGDTFALFGQTKFKPTADWLITPGLRAERTTKDFVRNEIVPAKTEINRSNSWNALLPSVTAMRQINPSTELAFTLARGFKPGGFSAYTGVASLTNFNPQRTWGLEAALTTSHPEKKWSFTSRAYAYRVSGYQIERSFAVPTTSTDEYLVANAKRAQSLGLETESAWMPVTDLTIRAIAGLTTVTLQDFKDPFTGVNYSGNRAPYTPSGNAALRVDFHPARGCFAGASLTWTGKTYYDEQQTAALAQMSYALLSADVGYSFAFGHIRFFGRNLTDKTYYSSITPGVYHGTPGTPFNWGGEINFRW